MRKKRIEENDNPDILDEILINPRKKRSSRTCRMCGKDPYPNYFYCPACHHRVSHSGHSDEHRDFMESDSA